MKLAPWKITHEGVSVTMRPLSARLQMQVRNVFGDYVRGVVGSAGIALYTAYAAAVMGVEPPAGGPLELHRGDDGLLTDATMDAICELCGITHIQDVGKIAFDSTCLSDVEKKALKSLSSLPPPKAATPSLAAPATAPAEPPSA